MNICTQIIAADNKRQIKVLRDIDSPIIDAESKAKIIMPIAKPIILPGQSCPNPL